MMDSALRYVLINLLNGFQGKICLTRMTTIIKTNFKISDDQIIDKYSVYAHKV